MSKRNIALPRSVVPRHIRPLPSVVKEPASTDDAQEPPPPLSAIECAAYKAIGLPHPVDVALSKELFHKIGFTRFADSEGATLAAIDTYANWLLRQDKHPSFLPYADYCHAVHNFTSLRNRMRADENAIASFHAKEWHRQIFLVEPYHTTHPIHQDFVGHFIRTVHTPDLSGYLSYLRRLQPDLVELLSKPMPVFFPDEARIFHSYVLGTTGSGKTELMKRFIHTYVTNPTSAAVVVLDPAGDFSREISRWKEFNASDRLIYLEHDLKSGMVPIINPLQNASIDPNDLSRDTLTAKRVVAREIEGALSVIIGDGEGKAFSTNMRRFLIPCLLTLLDRPGSTLLDLKRFAAKDPSLNRDLVTFALSRHHLDGVVEFFEHEFHSDRLEPTKSAISSKLGELFATGFFREMTCGHNRFDLEEELNKRKIIVFNLSTGSLGEQEAKAVGRLVIARLLGIVSRRDELDRAERVPIHVFGDEFHYWVNDTVKTVLREARKFGLHLTIAQQNVGQEMNHEMRRAVTGMTNIKISGKTEPGERARVAAQLDVDAQLLTNLDHGKGRFYVRFGAHAPFLLQVGTELLGKRHSMTAPSYRRLINKQVRAYYTPVQGEGHGSNAGVASNRVFDEFE